MYFPAICLVFLACHASLCHPWRYSRKYFSCLSITKFVGTKVVSSHEKYKYKNNDNNDNNRKDDNDNNDKYENTAAAAEYKRKMWKEWSEAININNSEIMDGMNMNMGNEMDAWMITDYDCTICLTRYVCHSSR